MLVLGIAVFLVLWSVDALGRSLHVPSVVADALGGVAQYVAFVAVILWLAVPRARVDVVFRRFLTPVNRLSRVLTALGMSSARPHPERVRIAIVVLCVALGYGLVYTSPRGADLVAMGIIALMVWRWRSWRRRTSPTRTPPPRRSVASHVNADGTPKVAYATREEAQRVATEQGAREGRVLNSYLCAEPTCGKWHNGHAK